MRAEITVLVSSARTRSENATQSKFENSAHDAEPNSSTTAVRPRVAAPYSRASSSLAAEPP